MDEFLISVAYLLQHTYNQSSTHIHTYKLPDIRTYIFEKKNFCLKMNHHQKSPRTSFQLHESMAFRKFKNVSVIKTVPQNSIIGGCKNYAYKIHKTCTNKILYIKKNI